MAPRIFAALGSGCRPLGRCLLPGSMILADLTGGGELVVGAAGQDRGGFFVGDLGLGRRAGELVVTLDEQPLLLLLVRARAHAHEVPAPFQPLPIEREIKVALGVSLSWIALRPPASLVPDDHGAAAVLALRDHALEGEVFHRVVFGVDGKPLLAGHEAWAAGDRPALQHAVELKPQVVMEPRRVMLLHAEAVASRILDLALGFCRLREIALLAVGQQCVGCARADRLCRRFAAGGA